MYKEFINENHFTIASLLINNESIYVKDTEDGPMAIEMVSDEEAYEYLSALGYK